MKKLLSLCLALLLVCAFSVPVFAEAFPLTETPVTFKMMGYKHPIQGAWENLWFFDYMEEKTGVHFEFDTPSADAYEERKLLALNSGDYADVFFGANFLPEQIIKYGSQEGILIPLEDLIAQYAPNVQAMFEAYPETKSAVTAPDGHIYTLPSVSMGVKWCPAFWYNAQWLEALNVTEDQLPTTVEGLYDLLVRFKNEDPNGNGEADEVPVSFYGDTNNGNGLEQINQLILPGFGILDVHTYFDADGKVQYGMMQDSFVHFIEYMRKLWDEKLIDLDIFSQDFAALNAKCQSNVVGLAGQAIPQNLYAVTDSTEAAKYPNSPALSSQYTQTPMVPQQDTGITMRGAFAITDACSDPALMMKWVDYLYSVEGSWAIHYGPQDAIWEYSDGENYLCRYIIPSDGRSVEEVRGGDLTPDCGTALPKWVRDDTEYRWADDFQQYRLNTCMKKLEPYAQLRRPDLFTTTEEQNRLDVLLVDLKKFTHSSEAKLITGEASIEEIPAMIETLKTMGLDEVLEIYQAAYDRWAAAAK